MRIGVPREIKPMEFRVGVVPDGARMLQAIVDLLEDPLLIIAQARK